MKSLQLAAVKDVRIGKHITLEIQAGSEEEARTMTETACKNCWPIRSWNPTLLEVFPMWINSTSFPPHRQPGRYDLPGGGGIAQLI